MDAMDTCPVIALTDLVLGDATSKTRLTSTEIWPNMLQSAFVAGYSRLRSPSLPQKNFDVVPFPPGREVK